VAEVVAAAAVASLSTLSASLMCCGDRPGMLRKCWSPDALRLGVVDREPDVLDCEYGDSSRELLREGMESGCKYCDIPVAMIGVDMEAAEEFETRRAETD
jgi:hypothetical protein